MISKHESLKVLLGQYFTYIYNKCPLNAYILSYCRAAIIARFASNIAARHLDKVVQASNIVSSMAMAASMIPSKKSSQDQSYSRRELEDNEGPFERDLDVEELFRRESYPLAERDVIDNGDLFVRDFGSEELYGREYDLLDERDIIDNEDLFVRDLEAGEFFGREYDSYFLD